MEVTEEKKEGSTAEQDRHDAADAGTDAGQANGSRGTLCGPDTGRQEPGPRAGQTTGSPGTSINC
jgi:hypothetical protein